MGFVEIGLGIMLAFMCVICGIVIIYDCYVDTKNVNLYGKKLGTIYAAAFFILGVVIFAAMIVTVLEGDVVNVHR